MGKIIWSKPILEGKGRHIKGALGKMLPPIMILAVIIGLTLYISVQGVAMHELTHKNIFRFYGIDSEITCKDELGLDCKTSPIGNSYNTRETQEHMYIGQAVNEAVRYNLSPYLTLFTMLFLAQTVFLMKIAFKGGR